MQTRRDQFQAYKYLVRRVLASMIGNDPEAPEQPMRRVGGATAIGVLFGGLACGGVAVYGWLVGSIGDQWKDGNNVVVQEKESGAQFVYTKSGKDDEKALHPIPNFTTAQLITGSAEPQVEKLTAKSLNTEPKGSGMGIPDAPALLPSVESLDPVPWTVCSRPTRNDDNNDQVDLQTDVVLGHDDIGADEADNRPIVVVPEGNEERRYVLYRGKRLEATREAVTALNFRREPLLVSPTMLNAVPAGDPLAGPQLPNRGEPGVSIGGRETVVGQVYKEQEQDQYWLVDAQQTRAITPVQANLLLARGGGAVLPGGVEQSEPTTAPQSELQAESDNNPVPDGDLPDEYPLDVPEFTDVADPNAATVCGWYDGGGTLTFTVNGTVPDASTAASNSAAAARSGSGSGAMIADHTIVDTGAGAVVGVRPKGGGDPSVYYVVTDAGKRYQIPADALDTLGYSGEEFDPPTLPARLLKLVPEGPVLSPEKAREPWP